MAEIGPLSSETSFSSGALTESSSNIASFSSTPPTTLSPDSMSLASDPDVPKHGSIVTPLLDAAIPLLEDAQKAQIQQMERDFDRKPRNTSPPAEAQEPNDQSGRHTPVANAIVVEPLPEEPPFAGRARRARASLPVYNLAKLSGTRPYTKRVANGEPVDSKRRRTIASDTPATDSDETANGDTDVPPKAPEPVQDGIDAMGLDLPAAAVAPSSPTTPNRARRIIKKPKSVKLTIKSTKSTPAPAASITRRATRLSGEPVASLTSKITALGKRSRKTVEKGLDRMTHELRRLQDTNEFAHIDTRPVRYTVWSNGKYIDPDAPEEEAAATPPRKKARTSESATAAQPDKEPEIDAEKKEATGPVPKKRRVKKWLDRGLYSGQDTPVDVFQNLNAQDKKKLASLPELIRPVKPNKTLPSPMYNGLRMLMNGRDFKLPFDICSPLPPGQPKPAHYRTMTKNRFVGDASAYWKKTPHFGDFASKCVCKPEDGCAEDCQNRIMLYECDETNCNVGKAHCQNRAFQNLQERTKTGGRYRVGVEVVKTSDRGYGVRSNRCFEPNQIIMEYTGEIITEEECDRRMNEVYKDNECYYLMSFDQNMIIDATTGSIARFVNHSCSPNCRMIKWIVSGQPRMALFAGDRPIMTGEELTYDYNFDPFSAKNVQKCLCGSPNCRGVLGPKPKEVKPPKPPKETKKSVKGTIKTGKRKLKEMLAGGDEEEPEKPAKKVKLVIKKAKKPSLSSAGLKAAKGAAKSAVKGATLIIRRGVASVSTNTKLALGSSTKKSTTKKAAATRKSITTSKKSTTTDKEAPRVKRKYVKKNTPRVKVSSRSSSLTTIVAAGSASEKKKTAGPGKKTPKTKKMTPASSAKSTPKKSATPSSSVKVASGRKRTPSWKVLNSASPDSEMAAGDAVSAKNTPSSAKSRNALDMARSDKIWVVDDDDE
ncbi:hypothetical protein B0T24DRAFT_381883 [Lasiosphaeria ovina]|uniref:Histone-lysine N-methyltransferase ASH1L n=1 Tax=Lasiosphaeria ovina TaxID=92902 RepID=A0AAE0K0J6_9PEZI|nr:hypothetical protein B0T24DRAFT_381883 [Lasiosphaeria ovina]